MRIIIDLKGFDSTCISVNLKSYAPSAFALQSTVQFEEARKGGYKGFDRADLEYRAYYLLQRQTFIYYQLSMLRYLLSKPHRETFFPRKLYYVGPHSFIPSKEDIDDYIEKPRVVYLFSRHNYNQFVSIVMSRKNETELQLLKIEEDHSGIKEFVQSNWRSFKDGIYKVLLIKEPGFTVFDWEKFDRFYDKFSCSLQWFETLDIRNSPEVYLHELRDGLALSEYLSFVITGQCRGGNRSMLYDRVKSIEETNHEKRKVYGIEHGAINLLLKGFELREKIHRHRQRRREWNDLKIEDNAAGKEVRKASGVEGRYNSCTMNASTITEVGSTTSSVNGLGTESVDFFEKLCSTLRAEKNKHSWCTHTPQKTKEPKEKEKEKEKKKSKEGFILNEVADAYGRKTPNSKNIGPWLSRVVANRRSRRDESACHTNKIVKDALLTDSAHPYPFFKFVQGVYGSDCELDQPVMVGEEYVRYGWTFYREAALWDEVVATYQEITPEEDRYFGYNTRTKRWSSWWNRYDRRVCSALQQLQKRYLDVNSGTSKLQQLSDQEARDRDNVLQVTAMNVNTGKSSES